MAERSKNTALRQSGNPGTRLGRLVLPDCPGCDQPIETEAIELNEQVLCPHCGSLLLMVRIDGVAMFLREGWA